MHSRAENFRPKVPVQSDSLRTENRSALERRSGEGSLSILAALPCSPYLIRKSASIDG